MRLYTQIAKTLQAMNNCQKSGNKIWEEKHRANLNELCKLLPFNSGFEELTKLDIDKSTSKKLVFITSFHHMNGNGYWDGWTEHKVIITPEFEGYSVRVTGKNKNGIKDYIAEVFLTV